MRSVEADDHEARKKSLATILSQNYGVQEESLVKAIVALGEGETETGSVGVWCVVLLCCCFDVLLCCCVVVLSMLLSLARRNRLVVSHSPINLLKSDGNHRGTLDQLYRAQFCWHSKS
jgi:hypothetical protein